MKRKVFVAMLLVLTSVSCFGYRNTNRKPWWDVYVGSKEYSCLVGGKYQKGDVDGVVYYISEDLKTMKIRPRSCFTFIRSQLPITHKAAEEMYAKHGFQLPTMAELWAMFCNHNVMQWNANYKLGYDGVSPETSYCFYLQGWYWTRERSEKPGSWKIASISLRFAYNTGDGFFEEQWAREMVSVNKERNGGYNVMDHVGTKTVPFEPQYITGTYKRPEGL